MKAQTLHARLATSFAFLFCSRTFASGLRTALGFNFVEVLDHGEDRAAHSRSVVPASRNPHPDIPALRLVCARSHFRCCFHACCEPIVFLRLERCIIGFVRVVLVQVSGGIDGARVLGGRS
jgi:hypothetical protein